MILGAPAAAAGEPPKTGRRDELLAIQATAQKKWEDAKVFEVDAPKGGEPVPEGKFFGNFPYPYMNGVLHLGHAFSISKLEFASAYHRLIGQRVLFPQGFHCTGMPIKACADRLRNETELYGAPPVIPEDPEPVEAELQAGGDAAKKKKSKVAAKKGKGTTQWDILKNSGIPEEEIPKFQNPLYWLEYFPPIAKADMMYLGCGVDWRRSFITTDVNPYYDSFVRWQLTTLKNQGKVVKDKRFAVYSPKDGQPCADHDRASGEGVGPQEYTLVKMKALELRGALAELTSKVPDGEVFFMAATLRPETMYGQTNCWVLPDGDYVAVQGPGKAVYVLCERAARNLSFQDQLPENGKVDVLQRCKGQDLIGTPLAAPNCMHPRIYVLPLLTILMTKGTGVVTSVPSDSPTDYMALQDLKKKEKFREKFSVQDDWVLPFDVVPIINIPGYGDKAAVKVCEDLKIQSQNDTVKLEEAKGLVYLKGFNEGVMTVGKYQGELVSEAKPKLRQDMLDSGDAIVYAEPESRVVSRSDDECVVALTDQWYITYGEEQWRKQTEGALANMNLYDETVLHSFQHTLGWLNQWACSRSFGLGTRVPWDPEFLIESLSDSTIYMAFYTVAHILQEGDMFGKNDDGAVKAAHLTHEVWDAIFLDKPVPKHCSVPEDKLQAMKDEFKFWYPFDLRVSGKDLIQNHLTFCLYNHTAIFPESNWPKAMRTNGHLLLNSDKMSKSTGNFLTLRQAVDQYSADAVRVALADSSDTNDDGNFEKVTANAAILRLTKELAWILEVIAPSAGLRTGERNLADKVFSNAISCAAHAAHAAYDNMLFRDALKASMYELQKARDAYRVHLGAEGMHKSVLDEYLDVSVRTLTPICPHWCEHVWGQVLGKEGSVLVSGWPEVATPDFVLKMAAEFIEKLVGQLKSTIAKKEAPQKKKKDAGPPPKVTGLKLHVAERFEGWRALGLAAAREVWDEGSKKLPDGWMAAACAAAGKDESLAGLNEKGLKAATMPFLKMKGQEAEEGGSQALEDKAPFDELQVLSDYLPHLKRSLGLEDITVHAWPAGESIDPKEGPFPMQPLVTLATEAPSS